jgi:integrase
VKGPLPEANVPERRVGEALTRPVPRLCRCRHNHDLRHTHASLLIAAGAPIKVVSERLGHSHPGFTMKTYQHVMPGMSAAAADQFASLITAASR